MLKYILKRILFFIPTIFAISLLTFVLMSIAPGDPVDNMLNRSQGGDGGQLADKIAGEKAYDQLRAKLGLNLPLFYFSLGSASGSDTLHRIPKPEHRKNMDRLSYNYGNWENTHNYYRSLKNLEYATVTVPRDSSNNGALIVFKSAISSLLIKNNVKAIESSFKDLQDVYDKYPQFASTKTALDNAAQAWKILSSQPTTYRNYIPKLFWYGTSNQYHRWLFGNAPWFSDSEDPTLSKGFIRGDFGTSYFAKRPVSSMIWDSISYTMTISFLAIIITYIISIPLGVYSAVNKDTKSDSVVTTSLFILYSLPSFWIGTMAIFFLSGGDYLDVFPPTGVADVDPEDGFLYNLGQKAYYLALPLICWTYGSFAYLSRQMRGGMLAVLKQDYIRTAQSKGLDRKTIIWKHAFRNSLLPIITIFSSVFPAMIGGSVALELIFSIPGMGKLGLFAVIQRDYPVVLTVTMFSAILTLIGYLVSDILYSVTDPRISFSKK